MMTNENKTSVSMTLANLRESIERIRRVHYTGETIKILHLVSSDVKARIEAGGDLGNEMCLQCLGSPEGFCRIDLVECECDTPEKHI